MDIEKDIIQDQKETIHRLQKECMEKTDIIEEMNKVIQDCNIQRVRLYKALEEIRGIVHKHIPVNIESFRKAEELPPVALGLQKILFKVDEVLV